MGLPIKWPEIYKWPYIMGFLFHPEISGVTTTPHVCMLWEGGMCCSPYILQMACSTSWRGLDHWALLPASFISFDEDNFAEVFYKNYRERARRFGVQYNSIHTYICLLIFGANPFVGSMEGLSEKLSYNRAYIHAQYENDGQPKQEWIDENQKLVYECLSLLERDLGSYSILTRAQLTVNRCIGPGPRIHCMHILYEELRFQLQTLIAIVGTL